MQKKRKSVQRFEQVNLLCDQVLRNLPTTTHGLVLLVGWRHADGSRVFRKSASELAKIVGVSKRHMQTILDDLIEIEALKIVSQCKGTIPTRYQITGKPRRLGVNHTSPLDETLGVNHSSARGEL